ncbi:MAG: GNAT family N-acetyltransferase [Bacillota bacterium]
MLPEIKVVQTRRELGEFLNLPKSIYGCEQYCPTPVPLETLNHARYRFFLALENGRPVGRVAAILDSRYKEQDTGFFGGFEAIRKPAVSSELLSNAEAWLAAQKVKRIIGPATFNTNQQVGLLIEGFDEPPTPFIPYNPPYYQELIEGRGFRKKTDLLSFSCSLKHAIPPFLEKIASRAAQRKGLALHVLKTFQPGRAVPIIATILNEAMANNWGYIPLTPRETCSLVNYCFRKGDPSLALFITIEKRPAAFSLCLPAGLKNHFARVAILAVVPEFRTLGLESLLIKSTVEILQKRNYSAFEISQVDENNAAMQKIIAKFPCHPTKRHRVYEKNLNSIGA